MLSIAWMWNKFSEKLRTGAQFFISEYYEWKHSISMQNCSVKDQFLVKLNGEYKLDLLKVIDLYHWLFRFLKT